MGTHGALDKTPLWPPVNSNSVGSSRCLSWLPRQFPATRFGRVNSVMPRILSGSWPSCLHSHFFKKSWQVSSAARRFVTEPNPEQESKDLPDFDPAPSFRLTMAPNPKWEPCQGASRDKELDRAWTHDLHGVKTWNPVMMPSRYVSSMRTWWATNAVGVDPSNLTLFLCMWD